MIKRDSWVQITVSADGYGTFYAYSPEDTVYLVETQNPLVLTLNWNNTGDYDFAVTTSGSYSFSRNRDAMSPPGGESINITSFEEDSKVLIYANYYSRRNMSENPATITFTWGNETTSLTYDLV